MDKKVLLYVLLGILVFILLILTFFPHTFTKLKYSDFSGNAIGDSEDKCVPPEGVSQEDWNEHMGHHPNIYKECFIDNS